MSKFYSLLFAVILSGLSREALCQSKDSTLIQKITSEFCTEFSKKDFTKLKGSEMQIGLIVVPIIEKYSADIEKEWKLSSDNEADYEKISEKIGQEATLGCPRFREFIMNNLEDLGDDEEGESKTVSGVFQRVDTQQFSSVVIKTKNGREEKLWWLGFFEGSEPLLKNPASLAGKNITVTYSEMEAYDARIKEYRSIKVIKKLDLK